MMSGGMGGGKGFRRLDEDVVQVQAHPPSNRTWVSASTPSVDDREMRMNAIRVQKDVELDRRLEVV